MHTNEVIITGRHLELTESLKNIVREKSLKLFHHDHHIIRFRVELGYNQNITHQKEYIAKGHLEIPGPDMVVTAESNDLYKSIDFMVDKLDRMLRRKSRLNRVKRKVIRCVEIPAVLPKMV